MPSLSRRSLLVAPGAYALLKPFVDCIEARADSPVYQPCFVVLYKTEGQYVGADHGPSAASFLPKAGPMAKPGGAGTITELSPILQSLTPAMDLISVVGGFRDMAQEKSINDYHHSNPNIFTGAAYSRQDPVPKFESLHWYVADRWKTEPLLLAPGWSKSFARVTDTHTAFRRVGNDVRLTTPIGQPLDAFQAAFGNAMVMSGMPKAAAPQTDLLARRGLIDFVLADSKRVLAATGREHKPQIERHIDGIQALSRKIGADAAAGGTTVLPGGACAVPPTPVTRYGEDADAKDTYTKGVLAAARELQQIALAAMRCGLRRVIGFDLVAEGAGDKLWPTEWDAGLTDHSGTTGKTGGYHFEYWHWATGPGSLKFEWMVKVEQYVFQQFFAPIILGMKATGTPDDNLLKRSFGVYGTQQTYNHSNHNHAFLVLGTANGKFVPRRSVMYRDIPTTQFEVGGRNINDFLLSMMQTMGFDATTYGDAALCSGTLPGFAG